MSYAPTKHSRFIIVSYIYTYIKQCHLVTFGTGDEGCPPVPDGKPGWCVCGVCRVMRSEEENKCCGKICCVTSFVTFQNTCTDREVLQIDYSTNSYRKAAYRQYILWRYKETGEGQLKGVPIMCSIDNQTYFPC